MPNVNTKTGIPYGAVNGNAVPYLLDEIFSSGESLTYAAWKEELVDSIRGALAKIADEYGHEKYAQNIDCEQLAETMLDSGLNNFAEFDEEEHEYSEKTEFGEVQYLQGWLGGAPLIWVTDSPFVAYARGCSPCVPGAGDLDNLTDAESGSLCYCCPPDCFQELDSGFTWEVVGTVEIDGRTYQIVGKVRSATITE